MCIKSMSLTLAIIHKPLVFKPDYVAGLSGINSFKKYDKKPNIAQFSMLRESMNNKSGKPLINIPSIDPDDMKVIEKVKRSVRFASALTNYDLSSYIGQLDNENSNNKILGRISETFPSSTEAFDTSSSSVFKFFSEHNVPISDDVMPIMDDNNMPIEINDLSVSNNLNKGDDDDNKSERSYDLMGDISEQKMNQERYHSSSRFGKSDSNFWKIDEEDFSLSDDENEITQDKPESINSSRQRTHYRADFHNSRKTIVVVEDDDINDGDVDPIASVLTNQQDDMMEYMNRSLMDLSWKGKVTTNSNSSLNRKKASSRSPAMRRSKTPEQHRRFRDSNRNSRSDPRKSGSSGILSISDDSQKSMTNNHNNTNTKTSEDDYFVSRWKEFGFISKEQASILMSIASTTISPDERRRLCSKVEIINDLT